MIIRFLRRTENIRSYAIKVAPLPVPLSLPVPLHLIRSARRRDSAARGTGRTKLTVNLVGERGERQGESDGATDGKGSRAQKSHDDFHLISRYSHIGGGDYGCPALSPRGGGFASSSSFSFSSFLVLALNCYPSPPLRAERWRPLASCIGVQRSPSS